MSTPPLVRHVCEVCGAVTIAYTEERVFPGHLETCAYGIACRATVADRWVLEHGRLPIVVQELE